MSVCLSVRLPIQVSLSWMSQFFFYTFLKWQGPRRGTPDVDGGKPHTCPGFLSPPLNFSRIIFHEPLLLDNSGAFSLTLNLLHGDKYHHFRDGQAEAQNRCGKVTARVSCPALESSPPAL